MANNGSANFLYAANARGNRVDVFDANFHPTSLAGNFVDPTVPAGFTPYGIQHIGNSIFVTYETRGVVAGAVAEFDLNGNFLREIGSSANGVPLDEPWGVALAPASFGPFGGDLLVGNKGDGHILAFNPTTGAFLGLLLRRQRQPDRQPRTLGPELRQRRRNADPNTLYFVAGINGETDGLLGTITAVPEPCAVVLFGLGALGSLALRRLTRRP